MADIARACAIAERANELWVTGSELIIGDDLLPALADIRPSGRLGAITSGYWAPTPLRADAGIAYLQSSGVTALILSVDEFHKVLTLEAFSYLLSGLTAARIDVTVRITFGFGDGTYDDAIVRISKERSVLVELRRPSSIAESRARAPSGAVFSPCDFGRVLYLSDDGTFFLCSGPAGTVRSRAVGELRNGQITWADDRFDRIVTTCMRHQVERRARNTDACADCNKSFMEPLQKQAALVGSQA